MISVINGLCIMLDHIKGRGKSKRRANNIKMFCYSHYFCFTLSKIIDTTYEDPEFDTKSHPMVKLKFWSFKEYGVTISLQLLPGPL